MKIISGSEGEEEGGRGGHMARRFMWGFLPGDLTFPHAIGGRGLGGRPYTVSLSAIGTMAHVR